MPLLLPALPADIILEIVSFLDLPDPILLLLTCSALYRLSHARSFWISILEETRRKYPLPCTPDADLSSFTLEDLKQLASAYQRLQFNWNRGIPQIARPITSDPLPALATILVNLHGTNVFVLEMGTQILCWDSEIAKPLPFPAIEVGDIELCYPIETPTLCTILILAETSSHSSRIYILTITHELKKVTSFTSKVLQPPDVEGDFKFLFLSQGVLGYMAVTEAEPHSTIALCSADSNPPLYTTHIMRNQPPVSSEMHLTDCFVYQDHVYSLIEDGKSVQIQHIPRSSLLSGHCENVRHYTCDIDISPFPICDPLCSLSPGTAAYGVGAVFVRLEWDDEVGSNCTTSFTWLPTSLTHTEDDGRSSPLTFGSSCITYRVDGMLENDDLVWLDHSGFEIVAVVNSINFSPRLILLRYHPATKSVSRHYLVVPDKINLRDASGLCVDEATGSLYIIHSEGVFSTLKYV
ncbi:F-box domain-containing protein [Favolaschia claudopus]|uniref:F-box domain-containing protein n=1 Tax=Favolaschia claudopus TaxID=2862362 RepID=A0AAW0E2B9_9AGAR